MVRFQNPVGFDPGLWWSYGVTIVHDLFHLKFTNNPDDIFWWEEKM